MSKLKSVWLFFLCLARFLLRFYSTISYIIEVGSFCFVKTECMGYFASKSDEKLLAENFWKSLLKEVRLPMPHSNSDLANFVLQEFDFKAMSDSHESHLQTEIFILSSVLEEFRKVCNAASGLVLAGYKPSHFLRQQFLKLKNPTLNFSQVQGTWRWPKSWLVKEYYRYLNKHNLKLKV